MKATIAKYLEAYGTGPQLPTAKQWESLLNADMELPLTVLNFFKLKEKADPLLIDGKNMTGIQAFSIYAETSVPKVAEFGGHFVLRGRVEGDFIGQGLPEWDVIAIGQYPHRADFLRLFDDTQYAAAFKFRQAAIDYQNVFLINAT